MKAITDINDPRLVKALAHPLRVRILGVLEERTASPNELSEELSAPLGNVSYHVRILAHLGLIKLVKQRPRRGAVEHFYRAKGRARVTDRAWRDVPDIVKHAMVDTTMQQIVDYAGGAAEIGGFDRTDAHLTRQPLTVDQKGWSDLAGALRDAYERVNEIARESAERLKRSGHEDELNAGAVLMLFEAPSGVPAGAPGAAGRARAEQRSEAKAKRPRARRGRSSSRR